MKKILILTMIIVLVFAAGCKKQEPEVILPTAEPSPSQTAEPAATPATTPEPSQMPQVQEEYVYVSSIYGFSVTMPASWRECCIIEEENMQVSFYSAQNRYAELDGEFYDCGFLFGVVIPDDSMKDENGYYYSDYEIIGQYRDADILVIYPSDVQIADTEDQDAVAEYVRMSEEREAVVDSILFG